METARHEGLRRRGWVLGEGVASLLTHQLGVWRSAVSSPSGVRGEAPAETDLGTFATLQKPSPETIFVKKNDILEPLVMLVNFLPKFWGCSNIKKTLFAALARTTTLKPAIVG